MKKKKKIKIPKFEKIIYVFTFLLLLSSPFLIVYTKSMLSEANYKLEKTKSKVEKQERENQTLEMEINEIVALDNIRSVIQESGLTYNNDNIKNVD